MISLSRKMLFKLVRNKEMFFGVFGKNVFWFRELLGKIFFFFVGYLGRIRKI